MKILDAAKLSQVRGGVEHGLSDAAKSVWDPAKEHAAPLAQAAVPHATPQPSAAPSHGGSSGGSSPPSPLAPEKPLDVAAKVMAAQPQAKDAPKKEEVAQVAAAAKADGKSDKEVEEMITLYHLSGAKGWADKVAKAKGDGKSFDELGSAKIDPDLVKKMRAKDPQGDGRGGDDLGPGFYTTDSKDFIDEYMAKNYKDNPQAAGIMQFQVPKSALADLAVKQNAPDDEKAFQQNMRDGFYSWDPKAQKAEHAKLDKEKQPYDLVSGPINDVNKAATPLTEGGKNYAQGNILKYGDETPQQFNWATEKAAQTLYGKSNSISVTGGDAWIAQREAEKKAAK
jgi:hypothetical protein